MLILDVGKVNTPIIRNLHTFYFSKIVPKIGYLLQGKEHSMYDYLPASARLYPSPRAISDELISVGFSNVRYKKLLWGSATIHVGRKI